MTEIWELSATETAAKIRSGELGCREAVEATVERMHKTNPVLNAVVDDLSEQALERASALDSQKADRGILHGVPLTTKVNIDFKGTANTNGVTAFKDVIAPAHAPVVENFEKSGAVVIGRTNTPEFSMRATTENPLHGRSFNPWNDWATSGGSSGGSSSAVMGGMGAIAHGNDIAGSLRYPAAAVGAATVKPGFGRTPAYNPSMTEERSILAQLMSVQGVICRDVEDVRLGMRSLVQYNAMDPWMAPLPFDQPKPDGPLTIGFTKYMPRHEMDVEVIKALDLAADMLRDAGYVLEEVELPNFDEMIADAEGCFFGDLLTHMAPAVRELGSETINKIFQDYFDYYDLFEGPALMKGIGRRSKHVRDYLLFLEKYPLVLTPFMPVQTQAWDRDAQSREGMIDLLGSAVYVYSMNFLGLPAGNIGAHFANGMPVSVQIIGKRFREDLILDACEAIEQRAGRMYDRLKTDPNSLIAGL